MYALHTRAGFCKQRDERGMRVGEGPGRGRGRAGSGTGKGRVRDDGGPRGSEGRKRIGVRVDDDTGTGARRTGSNAAIVQSPA